MQPDRRPPPSLDAVLVNLNETLGNIAGLLKTIELAILVIAFALAILLVGMTATCYYAKYKKYSRVETNEHYEFEGMKSKPTKGATSQL